jgi:hypothetical protein
MIYVKIGPILKVIAKCARIGVLPGRNLKKTAFLIEYLQSRGEHASLLNGMIIHLFVLSILFWPLRHGWLTQQEMVDREEAHPILACTGGTRAKRGQGIDP